MRPAPIPDHAVWPGGHRMVITGPDGDLASDVIAPVEAVVDAPCMPGVARFSVRCVLEPGDLDKLIAGGHVWISFYGHMVPFCTDITGPNGE